MHPLRFEGCPHKRLTSEHQVDDFYLLPSRLKFREIILAHTHLNDDDKAWSTPGSKALWMLFWVSAIPFVAFGFLVSEERRGLTL